jgi:hypothetical protein
MFPPPFVGEDERWGVSVPISREILQTGKNKIGGDKKTWGLSG